MGYLWDYGGHLSPKMLLLRKHIAMIIGTFCPVKFSRGYDDTIMGGNS